MEWTVLWAGVTAFLVLFFSPGEYLKITMIWYNIDVIGWASSIVEDSMGRNFGLDRGWDPEGMELDHIGLWIRNYQHAF